MSYIPPLVCDTPPPIDFEDSHEDDFGDGMFSNYDGKYAFLLNTRFPILTVACQILKYQCNNTVMSTLFTRP